MLLTILFGIVKINKMNNIVQCMLLTTANNRCSTILLQVVVQQAHDFWLCTVECAK